ncbi:hypothetical protein CQW23_07751 [Capsicum baccatum]|uniref:Uncharacterized protein n=1 Tax=Capsicum baccatum TaxID=33114 RepID=A0A2G2X784_CAPBA|nr:hypothetical protein CQW23_07751 [Capsicum baccatum]
MGMDREGGSSGSCYYSVLGILKDASCSDIRPSYRKLALDLAFPISRIVMLVYALSRTVYGALDNPKLTYRGNVKLRASINKISLLSVSVGLSISFCNASNLVPGTLHGAHDPEGPQANP